MILVYLKKILDFVAGLLGYRTFEDSLVYEFIVIIYSSDGRKYSGSWIGAKGDLEFSAHLKEKLKFSKNSLDQMVAVLHVEPEEAKRIVRELRNLGFMVVRIK